ncbi:asparaginase [Actibacterium lipolyticum]|uniref:L-asparaginase II n=1 Tax=Actibacterium lipolyticum TaxID=1524263 RepID=A0A238KVD9_9RHOB|nr:asparaginase [Actibacterium lipolyticum]SMX46658.1 L-asparaginase II [Actibacterium lipolyticum]
MSHAIPMVDVWRGPFLESTHVGHAVVCDASGHIVQAWGDADAVILPRSSTKMIQALPLVESGAADAFGLTDAQLALGCASHEGAPIHTDMVSKWLAELGLSDSDLRCGAEAPRDRKAKHAMIRAGGSPSQMHNNCSGKHSGFLTLTKHLGAGTEYVDPAHPVQLAVKDAFEDVTGMDSPGFGIDGCSAPNFGTTVHGLARAMAFFAAANEGAADGRERAAAKLTRAMATYPELVAGQGRACTELMNAMGGNVAVKTGAEAVFIAILPEQKLGVALKIVDGATRASECAIAAILVKLGVLEPKHPATLKRMNAPIKNWRGIETGIIRVADGFA